MGRATSSSANALGLCSSCTSVITGDALRPAHRENRHRNHLSDARGVRPHRSSFAKINHFRQRHRLRPTPPAKDDARHDDLVLRRLCLTAKRRRRERQWTLTPMAAAPPRYRPHVRPGNPGALSRPTSPPINASGSRCLSKPCLPSLERMSKSASLNPVALRSRIQAPRSPADSPVAFDAPKMRIWRCPVFSVEINNCGPFSGHGEMADRGAALVRQSKLRSWCGTLSGLIRDNQKGPRASIRLLGWRASACPHNGRRKAVRG